MEDQTPAYQESQTQNRQAVSFPGPPKPKKKVGMKIAILVVLLLLIGGIAWFLLSSDNPFSSAEISPTPTIATHELPTNTPSPTAAPVSKEELKVNIQNGTGVPGEAALLEKEMTKLGFKTIATGNADNKNYTKTQVSYSSRVPDEVKTEVNAKLQELYTSVDVSDSSAGDTDITIITGLRKGQKGSSTSGTPTPTVKGTKTSTTPTPTGKAGSGTPTPTGASGSGTITPTKTPTPTTTGTQ